MVKVQMPKVYTLDGTEYPVNSAGFAQIEGAAPVAVWVADMGRFIALRKNQPRTEAKIVREEIVGITNAQGAQEPHVVALEQGTEGSFLRVQSLFVDPTGAYKSKAGRDYGTQVRLGPESDDCAGE